MNDTIHHKQIADNGRHRLRLLWLPLLLGAASLQADPVDDAMVALEKLQMQWLAKEQSRPGVSIQPFSSDGCSGGLSDAWSYMAQAIPVFGQHFGKLPPWQHCCVEHDRAYWQGETVQGYQHRLQADRALQACVERTGIDNSVALSKRFAISQDEIEELFNVSAAMMYQAVRIGGKPCSYLPWRWGHGWPQCSPYIEVGDE